jgi:hypothetical protein
MVLIRKTLIGPPTPNVQNPPEACSRGLLRRSLSANRFSSEA